MCTNIALINIRSVRNKVITLCESLLAKKVSICCVTETWLTEQETAITAEFLSYGFQLFHIPRSGKRGGGVGILAKTDFKVGLIKPRHFKLFEAFQADVKKGVDIYRLSVIYRTGQLNTDDKLNFLNEFEVFLSSLDINSATNIVCGDFNIHVKEDNNLADDFLDLAESFGFHQQIKAATHVAGGFLDLLFVQECHKPINIKIYNEDDDILLSDHFLIIASFPVSNHNHSNQRVSYSYRKTSLIDLELYCQDLKHKLSFTSESNCLDRKVLYLSNAITSTLDCHSPMCYGSRRISSKPFTTPAIIEARREKRRAERRFKKSRSVTDKSLFNAAARNLVKVVITNQNKFYSEKLQTARNDSKSTFKIINSLLSRQKKKILPDYTNKLQLANGFAKFFQEKVLHIIKDIPRNPQRKAKINGILHTDEVNNIAIKPLVSFNAITPTYLQQLIQNTKMKYSSVDDIPAELLSQTMKAAASSILEIINMSLCNGTFPNHLKTSHITAIVKDPKGNTNSFTNYRPVSSLPIISKFIGKCILEQVICHIENNNLGFVYQSGFKKNHSCETALLKIYEDATCMLKPKNYILVLFLDFSAAFDTVDHGKLLTKLEKQFLYKMLP